MIKDSHLPVCQKCRNAFNKATLEKQALERSFDLQKAENDVLTKSLKEAQEHTKCLQIAFELYQMQEIKNEGKGLTCTQVVLACLREGNIGLARAIAIHEINTIQLYPDIFKFIKQYLFDNSDEYS